MLAATGAGMLAGLATGIFHTVMGIPAILAGILTQLGLYSVNLKIMGKANQAVNAGKYDLLVSLRNVKGVPLNQNTILIVAIFIVALIAILYWFFGTEIGCSLRATGCNPNMSRAQGINTDFSKVLGLMISNGLVALSSALLAQYQGFADVNMGRGAIVIGLAAVIIGEAIFGKIFRNFALRLLSVALGSILYYLVLQAVIWMGIDTDLLKLLSALVVAVFLAVPCLLYTSHTDTILRNKSKTYAQFLNLYGIHFCQIFPVSILIGKQDCSAFGCLKSGNCFQKLFLTTS